MSQGGCILNNILFTKLPKSCSGDYDLGLSHGPLSGNSVEKHGTW